MPRADKRHSMGMPVRACVCVCCVNIRNVYDVWKALHAILGHYDERYRINLNNKCVFSLRIDSTKNYVWILAAKLTTATARLGEQTMVFCCCCWPLFRWLPIAQYFFFCSRKHVWFWMCVPNIDAKGPIFHFKRWENDFILKTTWNVLLFQLSLMRGNRFFDFFPTFLIEVENLSNKNKNAVENYRDVQIKGVTVVKIIHLNFI